MKKIYVVIVLILTFSNGGFSQQLKSPNGNLVVNLEMGESITWSVRFNNEEVFSESTLGMTLSTNQTLGQLPKVIKTEVRSVDLQLTPVVNRRAKEIRDNFNELLITFKGDYRLRFRAYDYGMAYRFETSKRKDIGVLNEQVDLNFSGDMESWFPEEESIISHNERSYKEELVSSISANRFGSLPIFFQNEHDLKVLITEADLVDYPGMFLNGTSSKGMKGIFPKNVVNVRPAAKHPDRMEIIDEEAPTIAVTKGTRTFPWRVFYITDNYADLFEHDLVAQLSTPSNIKNTDWIEPGQVAWDWWNANNIYGVDFKSGINTETYKYYIDFAARYGIEYIIFDEGWSKSTTNLKEANPYLNLEELIQHGKEKGVEIILWTLWKPLDQDLTAILDLYEEWGIAGIKVDFMQRSDQYMVNYYERVAKLAAERRLLVDFHGAFKPSGLHITYPNVITFEGVKGLENSKESKDITPKHDVTIPFIRMVAGPMDYTPGAMINAQPEDFRARHRTPMSMGTRCHQVAMYVVYESPLQMLCDNPSNYYNENETTEFITQIPATWDETRYLGGEIGKYVVLARRNGSTWYIGAMNGQKEDLELELDLSFLTAGDHTAQVMRDGVNADKYAADYKKELITLKQDQKVKINMAPGGGWTAIIEWKKSLLDK